MAPERVERRLAAILVADMVGYSRLMGADEEGTIARQKLFRSELIDPEIAKHGGRIVKTTGDGLLVEFSSVVDAVQCSVKVQEAMAGRESGVSEDRRIQYRIGVNLGDIIIDGDDILGDGVNVAARLESLAEPGGICVSATVHDHIAGKTEIVFEDAGEQTVKNIAKPLRIWRWRADGAVEAQSMLALPDKPSIAVLPFENMSGDPEQEFFADGMAEDIITGLSKFRWLFVIARNSSFTYKGRAVDVKQIANELGVRYVMEGSIRRGGQRVRITAQLIDVESGSHIWAKRYDRQLDDVFAVQDEITEAIVAAIAPEIGEVERARAQRKPPDSLDAWGLYQRGLAAYYASEGDLVSAINLFDQVNELDPSFAPAFAMGADTRVRYLLFYIPDDSGSFVKQAQEKAHKAITLDPRDPICLWADGRVRSFLGQHDVAVMKIKEAIDLNPNYAMAHYVLGAALVQAERAEEAIPPLDRAMRLSPQDAFLGGFQHMRSAALFDLERYEECVEWASRAAHCPNPRAWSFAFLAAALNRLGRQKETQATLNELMARAPDFSLDFVRRMPSILGAEAKERLFQTLRKAGLPA